MKYYQVQSKDNGKVKHFTGAQANQRFGKDDWQHIRKGRVPGLTCKIVQGLPNVSTEDSKRISAKLDLKG